ncbi:MAG: flagellar hook-basal body complex protein, partial [Gammaproteobacteria bacterium]|nr:flagellar hook-basal body complex protein [Gammaproteobacteria bacterium]
MSFYTSLTGLNAATKELSVTSNNIANTATTGFKRSQAEFSDIFATTPSSKASNTSGAGVALKGVQQQFTQGNIESSGNVLDLAISGDGFFALQTTDGSNVYTRNGGFMLDTNNNVVNGLGQQLLGKAVDVTSGAASGALGPITVPATRASTTAETAKVTFSNLAAGETIILGGLTVTAGADGATAAEVASAFKSIAADGAADATGATIASVAGTLTGWSTGAQSGSSVTFTSTATGDVTDIANTGTGTASIVSSPASYQFTGMSIGSDGLLSVNYGDGSTIKTAKIFIAKFASNAGLSNAGDS